MAEGLISKGYLEEVGKGGHSGFWIIRQRKKLKPMFAGEMGATKDSSMMNRT
ncbi:hypothetical protein [Acinetobacter phage ABPH49]|nr:hypothetical protein [Acinetobacter phage ABPH49]